MKTDQLHLILTANKETQSCFIEALNSNIDNLISSSLKKNAQYRHAISEKMLSDTEVVVENMDPLWESLARDESTRHALIHFKNNISLSKGLAEKLFTALTFSLSISLYTTSREHLENALLTVRLCIEESIATALSSKNKSQQHFTSSTN